MIPVKGHDKALQVVADLVGEFPKMTLDIVGDGPLLPSFQSQAKRLGIADRVIFHGAVPHDQLPRYYQSADLHILTSRHEAFGMVIVEAAACGLPTVGFALGVMPEFAPEAGIAVPPGDVNALTQAIREILSDFERRRSMGKGALALVQTHYPLKVMAASIRDAYFERVNTSKPNAR